MGSRCKNMLPKRDYRTCLVVIAAWAVLLLAIRTSNTVSSPGAVFKKHRGREEPSFDATIHKRTFLKALELNNTTSIAYIFSFSGLGSQLMNFFTKAVYFADTENRSMIAIESDYPHYRLNKTMGVLTGYFSPQFPVIDTRDQYSLLQPYFDEEQRHLNVSELVLRYTQNKKWYRAKPWRGNQDSPIVKLVGLMDYREEISSFYNGRSRELYRKMVQFMCPHLQFNSETQDEIDKLLQDNGVSITHTTNGGAMSVAFHIRRGDKVATGESPVYQAEEYVNKLQSILQNSDKDASAVQTCFVATDDKTTIPELQETLRERAFKCELLWLADHDNATMLPASSSVSWTRRTSPAFTLQFLAELSVLIRFKYFIGTFNSNVGALVAVLRSCGRPYDANDHYGLSFGVDQDDWFFF